MERNAHYALVGLVSLLLLLGAAVFVVWLARLQLANQYAIYDVDFRGPVRGLSSGGEVFFNGIKVGEVTKLSLDARDPNRVVARIRTTADAPVRADSTASLEPQGVTGVSYIQITAGTPARPLLRDATPAGEVPTIPGLRGPLDSLLEGGGDFLARSLEALDRADRLMSDSNITAFSETLKNLRTDTALIAEQRSTLQDLDATLQSVHASSEKIARLSDNADGLLMGDGRRTLANLDAAATQLRGATEEARGAAAELRGPTLAFARNGLPQLSRTAATLQTAAEDLDRVVNEVERNPRQLLAKAPAKEIRVRP